MNEEINGKRKTITEIWCTKRNKMKRIFIGMAVSMDNIAVRDAEENRKGVRYCRKMETQKET